MYWFQELGLVMYVIVFTGGLGLVLGIAALASASKKHRATTLAVLAMTISVLGCAYTGYDYWNTRRVIAEMRRDFPTPNITRAERAGMDAHDDRVLHHELAFGLAAAALPLFLGAVAIARARRLAAPNATSSV